LNKAHEQLLEVPAKNTFYHVFHNAASELF